MKTGFPLKESDFFFFASSFVYYLFFILAFIKRGKLVYVSNTFRCRVSCGGYFFTTIIKQIGVSSLNIYQILLAAAKSQQPSMHMLLINAIDPRHRQTDCVDIRCFYHSWLWHVAAVHWLMKPLDCMSALFNFNFRSSRCLRMAFFTTIPSLLPTKINQAAILNGYIFVTLSTPLQINKWNGKNQKPSIA